MSGGLSVRECAERAGVSADTIRREVKRGKLGAYRIGNQVRIDAQEWAAYLRKSKVENVQSGKLHLIKGQAA